MNPGKEPLLVSAYLRDKPLCFLYTCIILAGKADLVVDMHYHAQRVVECRRLLHGPDVRGFLAAGFFLLDFAGAFVVGSCGLPVEAPRARLDVAPFADFAASRSFSVVRIPIVFNRWVIAGPMPAIAESG